MKRWMGVLLLTVIGFSLLTVVARAANWVYVDSVKNVVPNQTNVHVNVWVRNSDSLLAFVLPLEIRNTSGNGSYIIGSCVFQTTLRSRLGQSPLSGSLLEQTFSGPTTGLTCPPPEDVPLCSGPVSHTYAGLSTAVDFVSPDGFMWSGFSTSGPPQLFTLPPGDDRIGGYHRDWPDEGDSTKYDAAPSFEFVFNVNSIVGSFEIDTMCKCPANNLSGLDPRVDLVSFAFTKGTVNIGSFPAEAPVLSTIGLQLVKENGTLAVFVTASDPNGDAPALTAANLPTNATLLDNVNGTADFNFAPTVGQAGLYHVMFYATDNTALKDSEDVRIIVNHLSNLRPVLDFIRNDTVREGSSLEFRVTASDPNGGYSPLLVLGGSPPGTAQLTDSSNGAGLFHYAPGYDEAGFVDFVFIATDGFLADTLVVTIEVFDVAAAVRSVSDGNNVPTTYALDQNYPNPFNAGTVVRFALPHDSKVRLEVFNVLGRKVRTLLNEFRPLGVYAVDWDGTDDRGKPLSTGVYFYRIQTEDYTNTRSMLILK
ncbi:MAG: T9SS type A sorting domain-containing protein [Candidatus Zixiibacteriota bacterium]